MNKSLKEWAERCRDTDAGLPDWVVRQLGADLEAAQAEHERELADLRARCAEAVEDEEYPVRRDIVKSVRAVPLRRPREGE